MDPSRETEVDIPHPAADMDRVDSSQGSLMVAAAVAVMTEIPSDAVHCRRGRDLPEGMEWYLSHSLA
jgi:hypothetical protein